MSSILRALERARQERERGHAHQRSDKNVLLPVDPSERLLDRPAPPPGAEAAPHPYAPPGLTPQAAPRNAASPAHASVPSPMASHSSGFPVWAALLLGTVAGLAMVMAGTLAFLAGLGARGATSPLPADATATPAQTWATPLELAPTAMPAPGAQSGLSIDDDAARAAITRLEADPFVSMVVAGQPTPPPTPTAVPTAPPAQTRRMHADDFTAFRIDAVMLGGREPLVMILGRERTLGDVVQGYEIIEITSEFVSLAHESTRYDLRY